jgi:hypothetical protein
MNLKTIPAILTLLLLCLGGCANAPSPDPVAKLSQLMIGRFSSAAQAAADSQYGVYEITTGRIWTDRRDGTWVYLEQAEAAKKTAPYRQRIYQMRPLRDGKVLVEMYTIKDPKRALGAYANAGALISDADLEPLTGCGLTFAPDTNGTWRGATKGKDCRNTYKSSAYMTSLAEITATRWVNWDRGFKADDSLAWGPAAGGYVFDRQ